MSGGDQAFSALAYLWVAGVSLLCVWQSVTYTGWIRLLTEWQFDRLGQSFPAVTMIALIALFGAPPMLFARREFQKSPVYREQPREGRLWSRATRLSLVLSRLAVIFTIATAAALSFLLFLPSTHGALQHIDLDAVATGSLSQAPAVLTGKPRGDRSALFTQHLLWMKRAYRFIPVLPSHGDKGLSLTFFVETDAGDLTHNDDNATSRPGLLRKDGLPGAVAQVFRDAGYSVNPTHYVIYTNRAAMYWPILLLVEQLAVVALILALASLVVRRRMKVTRDHFVLTTK